MQAVEKPKCETISPWALQRDQKLSLGSQSDQRAKYNAKEVRTKPYRPHLHLSKLHL